MSQHKKLILALLLAILAGLSLHPFADIQWINAINSQVLQPVGQIFLRMILMAVVPLIFSALVIAVSELGNSRDIGKIALKTLAYTVIISALSVVISVALVNILKPGQGFRIDENQHVRLGDHASVTQAVKENAAVMKPVSQIIVDLLPKNPLDSAAHALDGEILPFMIFALIFGIALTLAIPSKQPNLLVQLLEQIFSACMRVMQFAMAIAPYGVFALVFNTVFVAGYKILISLSLYVATVIAGLLIQQFVVYGLFLRALTSFRPWQFFEACQETYLYAFSTSSSNATLPKALLTAEHKLGIPRQIARFVLTVGASANQNGTAIFEGITVLFLAQVYGVDLSLSQQIYVVLFAMLAGIGTAGVPGGSLPLIMVLLQSISVPVEGIGLILGVDRFLDMCRTVINVSGDLVIAALVTPKKDANRDTIVAVEIKQ